MLLYLRQIIYQKKMQSLYFLLCIPFLLIISIGNTTFRVFFFLCASSASSIAFPTAKFFIVKEFIGKGKHRGCPTLVGSQLKYLPTGFWHGSKVEAGRQCDYIWFEMCIDGYPGEIK